MYVDRVLYKTIESRLSPGKAVILMGPRQSGKSTILNKVAQNSELRVQRLDCDDAAVRARLEMQTLPSLQHIAGNAELVLIDEAQRVKNIGLTLKIILDQIKSVRLLVSGSSSFELANQINEPLTGRKWEYTLLPFSVEEMMSHHGAFEEERRLHSRLLFGMYPEVVLNAGQEREVLNQLATSYLYRDIFTFQELRKPELLDKLLKALAFQIGSEVSYNKLAEVVSSDISTVQRYIDLLEKTFIVFRLQAFSRNLRNELKRTRKIYFYDNGIRNSIIGDFRPINLRDDIGGLWENFLVSERLKRNKFHGFYGSAYFWRTVQQQELDYLEEYDGQLYAYEFKWNANKKKRLPASFFRAYPGTSLEVVHPGNYQGFLAGGRG
ncbi:MAG: ATP-binding protein [Lewinellaceae bacterium]|nr:ATP-binding protein [Lewinellaceae bacterium]